MSNKGTNSQSNAVSDSQLDAKQVWAIQNLRPLILLFIISTLLCFVPWVFTTLVLPAGDMQQGRDEVLLKNGRKIAVQYPKQFLADDTARPIYLTADSLDPVTITIKLDTNLPLILTSVVSSSTTRLDNSTNGNLVITWPLSSPTSPSTGSSVAPGFQSPAIVSIPSTSLPNTAILYFKNARTESGWFPGVVQASLGIDDTVSDNSIKFGIETTNRASWRAFAEKYPFIAILPFLVTAAAFLFTTYTNRRLVQERQKAHERLEALKTALSNADGGKVSATWDELLKLRSHLSVDDKERAERLIRSSRGEIPSDLVPVEFNTWTDVWVGALILAGESLQQKAIAPEVAHKTEQTKVDQAQSNGPNSAARDGGDITQAENNQSQLNRLRFDLYRCIRMFPVDLLLPEAEERLREFREELVFPIPQPYSWPKPPEPPRDFPQESSTTIATLRLFPSETGDAVDEIGYLFTKQDQSQHQYYPWYWHKHPLHTRLETYLPPVLVCGDAGSGRTALALALTRYAEREDRVLGSYHDRPISIAEAQEALARELLTFIRWHLTWLTKLEPENRDLLASLLLGVFDNRIVLARLGEREPTQFDPPKPQSSSNQSDSTDDDKNRPIWEAQAAVEFRLLRQSVERMMGRPPLSPAQWFYGLSRCAKQVGFERVRIALDMTRREYKQWHGDHLDQFLTALSADVDIPVQLIVLVPGSSANFEVERRRIELQQLQWSAESEGGTPHLVEMLKWRFGQRTKSPPLVISSLFAELIPDSVQHDLCIAAQYNPRRLARLWNRIASEFPDERKINNGMVTKATAEVT